MKTVNRKCTLCETLRQINDMHQSDSDHDKRSRELLCLAESMSKRMAQKLFEYSKKFDDGWWEANPEYQKILKQRLNERYCVG
jgi:hypothetical protein